MKKALFTLVIFVVLGSNLYGLDVTLEQAKERALKKYPPYLAAQEELKAAKAGRWSAYSGLLPSASLNASQIRYEPEQNIGTQTADKLNTYGISVTQPIFNGGKIWLGARIQEDVVKMAEKSVEMTKFQTLAGVEEQYFAVLQNEELLKIAHLDLETSTTNLEIAQTKYDAGLLTHGEFLQIKSENTSKFVNVLQMKNLYQTSKMGLMNYLQIGSIENISPVDTLEYQSLMNSLRKLTIDQLDIVSKRCIQYGIEHNPALKIADISVNTNKKSVLMAGGNFLPSVNLSYSKNWSKYNFSSDYSDNQTITLAASLPIFPIIDNVSDFNKSKHELKKVKYDYQNTKQGIITGIESQLLNMVSAAHSIIASYESKKQAKETYARVQESFRQGLSSTNELLAAQTLLLASQNQYVQSFYDFLKAHSALKELLGSEDDALEQLLEIHS